MNNCRAYGQSIMLNPHLSLHLYVMNLAVIPDP